MELQMFFSVNDKVYLKNPSTSELGLKIVNAGIELIHEIGFEDFTFKKLAVEIHSTEASIYRYFENKHKLLLYIISWYWSFMEFELIQRVTKLEQPEDKLNSILQLITEKNINSTIFQFDLYKIIQIVKQESNKIYMTKNVDELNKSKVFAPYKRLCGLIADIILEAQPNYAFPLSLSSTLIETALHHRYFVEHLPKLTDINKYNKESHTFDFLDHILFTSINKKV